LALRTDQIPVFTIQNYFPGRMHIRKRNKYHTYPWYLAPSSCDRADYQCYFLPTSPCTITEEDMEAAPNYGFVRKEQSGLALNKTIPPELEHHRIIVLKSGMIDNTEEKPDMREIASVLVEELLAEWKTANAQSSSKEEWNAIELAHRWIIKKTHTDPEGLL